MATMILLFTTYYGLASQTIEFEPTLKYNAMELCEAAKPGVVEAFQTKGTGVKAHCVDNINGK